ncbi:hypothetical protein DPMN_114633 [Dreissena polymorpha]|uniref:Uncharacterized protein n=2 Tax=Dreissena polymorpha TaxID=45954 RepID=A0A9D4KJR6_DREPO|nr:hypothetical protein DPMN_114633 [Dreissena polymorpha]
MSRILAISRGKGPAFRLKKMIDGFFEPEDVQGRKAKELGNSHPIMRAIKLYAFQELKMKETTFIHELNSKLNSFRRVINLKRNEKRD